MKVLSLYVLLVAVLGVNLVHSDEQIFSGYHQTHEKGKYDYRNYVLIC